MILDRLDRASSYAGAHPLFAHAFRFLARPDLASLPDGRHETGDPRVYALVSRTNGRGREASPLEAHDRNADIQVILAGTDTMGWRDRAGCARVKSPYDAAKDLILYEDAPADWFDVPTGFMAVFLPEDAHAPLAGKGAVHKVVVKVSMTAQP